MEKVPGAALAAGNRSLSSSKAVDCVRPMLFWMLAILPEMEVEVAMEDMDGKDGPLKRADGDPADGAGSAEPRDGGGTPAGSSSPARFQDAPASCPNDREPVDGSSCGEAVSVADGGTFLPGNPFLRLLAFLLVQLGALLATAFLLGASMIAVGVVVETGYAGSAARAMLDGWIAGQVAGGLPAPHVEQAPQAIRVVADIVVLALLVVMMAGADRSRGRRSFRGAFRVKTVGPDGGPPGWGAALGRNAILCLPAIANSFFPVAALPLSLILAAGAIASLRRCRNGAMPWDLPFRTACAESSWSGTFVPRPESGGGVVAAAMISVGVLASAGVGWLVARQPTFGSEAVGALLKATYENEGEALYESWGQAGIPAPSAAKIYKGVGSTGASAGAASSYDFVLLGIPSALRPGMPSDAESLDREERRVACAATAAAGGGGNPGQIQDANRTPSSLAPSTPTGRPATSRRNVSFGVA